MSFQVVQVRIVRLFVPPATLSILHPFFLPSIHSPFISWTRLSRGHAMAFMASGLKLVDVDEGLSLHAVHRLPGVWYFSVREVDTKLLRSKHAASGSVAQFNKRNLRHLSEQAARGCIRQAMSSLGIEHVVSWSPFCRPSFPGIDELVRFFSV